MKENTIAEFETLPDWYWKHGLHDAEILSFKSLQQTPDWKSQNPRYNCLEILINASGAMFETDIVKISLFNYKIKSEPIDGEKHKKLWWMRDTINQKSKKQFNLDVLLEDAKGHKVPFNIDFEMAEVERK